jgi:hypothetical protein
VSLQKVWISFLLNTASGKSNNGHSFAQSTIANPITNIRICLFVWVSILSVALTDFSYIHTTVTTTQVAVTKHRAGVQFVASGKPNA